MKSFFSVFLVLLLCNSGVWGSDLVTFVSPKGELIRLADAGSIVVTFSEAMVPLSVASEGTGDGPMRIDPPIPGKYRWLGTRTCVFTPADTLPYASHFVVTIPAGVRSLSGRTLEKPYQWDFVTPRPRFQSSYPPDRSSDLEPDQPILLRFDQPMAPERVGKAIVLIEERTGKTVAIEFEQPSAEMIKDLWSMGRDTSRVLQLKPLDPMRKACRYRLQLKQGLLAAEGELGSQNAHTLHFETYGPLRYRGWSTQQGKADEPVDPTTGILLKFTNRVRPCDLVDRLHFQPPVAIPETYRDRDWGQDEIYLAIDLLPDTLYTFEIDTDLVDIYGNKLENSVTDSLRTGDYSERVILSGGPGVLEAHGDRRFPIYFVNKPEVRLRMGEIPKEDLIGLLTAEKPLFSSQTELSDEWFMVDRVWRVDAPRNTRSISALQVDWVLARRSYGLVLAQIDDPKKKYSAQRILLQVTDLGISTKFSAHNNVVWVTRLSDAQPVVGARVEIRDDRNRLLWEGETDSLGLAETPGWKTCGIEPVNSWERPRQWVFVSHQGDFAYSASDWGTGIYPYRFGIDYEWNPQPSLCQGVLFTDRGLYRAGETVYLKGLLRRKKVDSWTIPVPQPIRLTVRDGRGDSFHVGPTPLSEWGAFDFEILLQKSAHLGAYWVAAETLAVQGDTTSWNEFLWSGFQVEAFRAAEFKVSARIEPADPVLGDSIHVDYLASYLFGAPMAGQPLSYRLMLTRGYFSPLQFSDFQFGPLDWGPIKMPEMTSSVLLQGEGHLDESGHYQTRARLEMADCDYPLELLVSADVMSPTHQMIGTVERVPVHPAGFYVGLRQSEFFTFIDKPVLCSILAVDASGQRIPNRTVQVQLIRREWHSVRKAGVAGRYQWLSKTIDSVVDSTIVTTENREILQTFQPKSPGLYFIRATARDERGNRTATDISFYVAGKDYVPWERSEDDRIELIADQSMYAPGDIAQILVKSPFESAEVLVTIEREGILSQETLTLQGSAPTIAVPIESDYLPNVFVSVILLKGRTADQMFSEEGEDVGRPAFKIGYVNLAVSPESKRLQVTVEPNRSDYQPGDSVFVAIRVAGSAGEPVDAQVAVSAADAGVLNLIGYRMPDPFDIFYGMRPLSVQTCESRLHIIEQRNYGEKGENRGGGGADQGFAGAGIRRDFKPSAYWNPSVRTGADGIARVSFVAPDNLSAFRVMAVAQSRDHRFGRGETEFRTNQPLLMQPALPAFLRVRDRCQAGVVVYNYTGKTGTALVEIQSDGITVEGDKRQSFTLASGESREVTFQLSALRLGDASLTFLVRLGEFSDALERPISILELRRPETAALYQRTEESTREKIAVPDNIYEELSSLVVTVSASALSRLSGPVSFLSSYPYRCLEQEISRHLPLFVAGELLNEFNLMAPNDRQKAQDWLQTLTPYETGDGGMGLWPSSDLSSPFVSIYAAYALTQAVQTGFEPPKGLLERLLQYSRDILTEKIDRKRFAYKQASWRNTDLFALYVLTMNGRADAGYVERFYASRNDLSFFGRAYLLKTLYLMDAKDARIVVLSQELANSIRVSPSTAYFADDDHGRMEWIYHSNVRSTALVLQTLLEIGADFALAERVVSWLIEQQHDGHWRTTQENIYALHALAAYYTRFEQARPNFEARVGIAKKQLFDRVFDSRMDPPVKSRLSLAGFSGKQVEARIDKKGEGTLYYSLLLQTYPHKPIEPRDEGLTVLKTLSPVPAQDREFNIGDLIQVELQVIASHERRFVVVDDPLPAGFEAVQLSFTTADQAARDADEASDSNHWVFDHVERQTDRVLLYSDRLPAGVHRFTYFARATTRGNFAMPATQTEEMYHPEIYGRSTDKIIQIH
ncbi:Ig-like domain-containing protein [candidate division KSB1 bacterium]|nr:Ig-like domain-containing protein [candidate division KSB1 bacterium]